LRLEVFQLLLLADNVFLGRGEVRLQLLEGARAVPAECVQLGRQPVPIAGDGCDVGLIA